MSELPVHRRPLRSTIIGYEATDGRASNDRVDIRWFGFGRRHCPGPASPLVDPDAHAEAFTDRVIELLAARQADPAGTEAHLQAQVAFAVAENSWARRAEQWNTWLSMA